MDVSIRKKEIKCIAIFTILVLLAAFFAPLLGGSPSSPGPGFVIWGIAPLVIAVLMRIVTKDWLDAGFKPAVRKNALWYIICILAYPLMTVVMLIIGNIFAVSSISEFSVTSYLKTFLTALPVFLVFSIFEEFGWRGYLVPKLASTGINDFLGYAIVAVVWASWHLPYIRELSWVYTSDSLATFFPRFYLSMFAFSILYSEVRIITGSVWPAVLMHCISNSFAHPLLADYVKITQGKEYLISSTGLIMTACIGLLGIILNRWRVKNEALLRME